MHIELEALMIGRVLPVQLSSEENVGCCGLARNKPQFLCQLLKKSILLLLPIVCSFYG